MDYEIVRDPLEVFFFIKDKIGLNASEGMLGLGLKKDGQMVVGVILEGINKHNGWIHCAAVPGRRWMTKQYLKEVFKLAFVELGLNRLSAYANASNADVRRFDEHLGFKQEATLKGAAPDGGDVIIYAMWREECRYV